MSGIILPPKWTGQPQFPTRLRRDLLPVAGFNAAAGFVDTEGATFTVGSGITTTVNSFGKEADFNGTSSALTRNVNVSSAYPKTFVAVCRHDTSGVRMLGSLSTSADKPLRVYMESGTAYAQYFGASTNASASVNFLSYGQVGAVVAVFRAQNDVTLYVSGNVAKAKSRVTTDVGAPTTPNLLAFGAYNGSVVNQYLDGGLGMAAWLGVALSEQEAWSVLDNPWQIFQPLPNRLFFGAATASGTAAITQADGTSTTSSLGGSSTAATTPTAAAGTSTAASLTGAATAATTLTAAAGASTASTVTGGSTAAATITQADGASTAATLTGAGLVAGASSITAADGASTAGTLAGSSVAASAITPAAGAATAATFAASAVAASIVVAAAGATSAATIVGSTASSLSITGPARARIGAATLRRQARTITLRDTHARIGSQTL